MSLHWGLLAAPTSSEALLAELSRHAGDFVGGDPLPEPFVIKYGPEGEEWDLAIGEHDGKAFLFDPNMALSGEADLIVAMSEPLGLVVGGFVEGVSGTSSFTLARSGELVRHVFANRSGMSEDFHLGEPLAFEDEEPLTHPWGYGLYAGFTFAGLAIEPWMKAGPATGLAYTAERRPADGPIGRASNDHYDRYETAEGRRIRELMRRYR